MVALPAVRVLVDLGVDLDARNLPREAPSARRGFDELRLDKKQTRSKRAVTIKR